MDVSSVPVNPSVQVNRPLPQSQPTPIVATTASLGSTPLPTTVPVLPVTCGGTVYYLRPPVVTTPVVVSTSTQSSSLFPSANATPFVPSSTTSVTQTSVPSFTIQDVAQIPNTGFNEEKSPTRVETVSIKRRPYSMA